MKNLRILAMAALAITLGSCSSDDNSDNNSGSIEGTYELREFNTSTATDFNRDGTSSTNQMSETECYNDAQLTFRSDNTFTYEIAYLSVNSDASSTCTSYEVDGTWTATNNTLTATYENLEGDDVVVNFARTDDGRTLTENRVLTNYPDRNADGVAINRLGNVQLVFKK
ncbi:lipocalin family protein [uncultured Flavobacterium sp.]|uniref:DUF5004 domain-containing protein n=1 Tax=uncultured Flavobacterium sp. TaxID=165435 RepID=UPI0025E228E0|nr:lipocalin family protein [uncultured Flavobacterium sp.]